MKGFFVKLILMSLAVTLTSAVVWFLPGTYFNKLAMMINKKQRLASIDKPRLVLIGGSNLFGVNSGVLQKELNMNVANFGCWGGFRVEDIYDGIEKYLSKGDTVVVVQEYYAMCADCTVDDPTGEMFTFLFNPTRVIKKYFINGKPHEIISLFFRLMQMKVKSYIKQISVGDTSRIFSNGFFYYSRLCNKYGDREIPFMHMRPLSYSGKIFTKFDTSHLYEISRRCSAKGITVAFSFSPLPVDEYEKNKKSIHHLYNYMRTGPMPLLNAPEDNIYPDEFFADSAYHLTDEGEKIRTARLVQQLKRFFEDE